MSDLARDFLHVVDRATLLGFFNDEGPAEIPDPYELAPEATHAVLMHIVRAIEALSERLPAVLSML